MMFATSSQRSVIDLEQLVDHPQLDQLLHVVFLAEQLRHRRAHHAVGVRLEPVDLLADLEDRAPGRFTLVEQRHRVFTRSQHIWQISASCFASGVTLRMS